jgi:DNA invertase Pin-like site-specific DNA recombinase
MKRGIEPNIRRRFRVVEENGIGGRVRDARKARVVEMRYFGGLTAAEIASVLGVSPQTVNRDWNLAKAWLARALTCQERNERPMRRTHRI